MPKYDRESWSQEADDAISSLVKEFGLKHWTQIAKALKDRFGIRGKTGKQCRERWFNHLDPDIKIGWWTVEEEQILIETQREHGNCWSKIATFLPGRTENAIKNYFYSTIRRNLRRYNRRVPEDQRIAESISEIIQKPEIVSLLMVPSDKKKAKPDFEQSLRKSSRLQAIKETKPEVKEIKEENHITETKESKESKSTDEEGSSILYSLYETPREELSPGKLKSKIKPAISVAESTPALQNPETANIFENSLFANNFLLAPKSTASKFQEESPLIINWEQLFNPISADNLIPNQDQPQTYNRSDSVQSYLRCDSSQSYLRSDSCSNVLRQDSLNDNQPPFDITGFLLPHFTPKDTL
ncbi:unnamed protein product [Blepharisma stoltei]|uniref:Myb-like DNA-binding domain containing protein n=1 Tax=Blepharisma stoltei TaxID=1481888 RepID=A0AAU9JPK9_9CILI|nr:unnamed protein product [Blepharisma stoltei]